MRNLLSKLLPLPLALPLALLTGCPSASTPRAEPPAVVEPTAPAAEITPTEDGFWDKTDEGTWRYDLAVSFVGEVQLSAQGDGRGLVRVTLPPGATKGRIAALTVKYVRGSVDMGEDPSAAGGKARWHVHADANGRPGARLGGIEADIDGKRATPLDYEFTDGDEARIDLEGTRHTFATPVEVPQTFWLVFERAAGDPRVGGMWLTEDNGLLGTYTNLFFIERPDAPLGPPKNIRPLLALDFAELR